MKAKTNFLERWLTNLQPKSGQKYYRSIDTLPWWNWDKILATGDKKYLIQGVDYSSDYADSQDVHNAWVVVFDEYMAKFGQTRQYEEWMALRMRLGKVRCEYLETGTRSKLNFIKVAEKELEIFEKKSSDKDKVQVLASLSKSLGYHLKSKEITVDEVYSYISTIKND